ncbi:hypothetical protein EDB89DRAFT_1998092 [Lactarius sanguifluus]|nr:hypothetical protein EDB89DRAFT_1998092 [Lactarius sanguifluus]
MPTPPPGINYTCWASADDWRPEFIILGANVNAIPTPPPQTVVIIGTDGFWGAHDFPYLAWIPIPLPHTSIPSDKTMWQAHSHTPNTRVINPALLDELTREWTSIEDAVQDLFKTISSNPSFSYVQHPKEACVRAVVALGRLENDFGAWRDFVEVYRNLQRSLLELRAFLSWWKDACASDDFQSSIRAPTRGSIFYDKDLFANHARWSVAAFLLIHKSMFTPDPAKKVSLSPRTLCDARPMPPHPPPSLSSSLVLSPSRTRHRDGFGDRCSRLRGTLRRLHPTKVFKRTLDKIENKRNDEAGRKAKVAKVTQSHLELRHLTDAAPDWFTKPHEIWLDAMNYVKDLDFAPTVSHRRFALPPVHLFWGGSEQNQRTYYYHFFLLHQEIVSRRATERRFPGPHHPGMEVGSGGNTYWKQQWPKHDGNVSPHDNTFDPDAFWKHGGPLLFGDELSAEIAAGRFDPTSTLPCCCAVRMDTADDPDVRQAALYQLARRHLFEEIREMERLQFPDNPDNRWLFKFPTISSITRLFGPSSHEYVDPHFHVNERWMAWALRLRDIVMGWDGFDRWDWDGLPDVGSLKSLNMLWIWRSMDDIRKFIIRLLAFLIHSFVTRLGYYPSPLRYPPTLNTHSCDDPDHRTKFGTNRSISPFRQDYVYAQPADSDTQPAKQVASSTAHRNAHATGIPLREPPNEVRTKTTKRAQRERKRRAAPAVHPKE